jgi:hypothetical protein
MDIGGNMARANFTMQNENITLVRGDTLSFGIVMYGDVQTLDSAYFTVKKDYNDSPVVQKSIGDGITESAEGEYTVRMAPEDTKDLELGRYYYDLQVGNGGDDFTILRGILDLVYDVTEEV